MDDCKKYGTLAFAGIARCAFISKSILDSLVESKVLDKKKLNDFYLSVQTISKNINNEYIEALKYNNFKNF